MLQLDCSILDHALPVAQATEQLYAAFAAYTAPKKLEASPYRDSVKILADLQSAPLRELGDESLRYFANTAISTVGDENDYKHFLPRILQIGFLKDASYWIFALPGKLRSAGWNDWPKLERKAVLDFIVSNVAFALGPESSLDYCSMQEWIVVLVELDQNVVPLLVNWKRTNNKMATDARFLAIQGLVDTAEKKLNDESELQLPFAILQWLTEPATETYLRSVLTDLRDADFEIQQLLQSILNLRRTMMPKRGEMH
jgi:hypothetical protein